MPTESKSGPPPEAPAEDVHAVLIRRQVRAALGRPADGPVVRVCALWGNRYRANVFHGDTPIDGRITQSYFLVVGDDGTILQSDPALPG